MTRLRDRTSWEILRRGATLVVRWLLAAVYFYAGAVKLWQDPDGFADSIASFRLLPHWLVNPLALALPPFELLIGIGLLTRWPKRLGALGALTLGSIFLVALAVAVARGLSVDCGCFGAGPGWLRLTPASQRWFDTGRDGLIVLGGLFLYRRETADGQGQTSDRV